MSSQDISGPGPLDERYASFERTDGQLVIYDSHEGDAFVQSTLYVSQEMAR